MFDVSNSIEAVAVLLWAIATVILTVYGRGLWDHEKRLRELENAQSVIITSIADIQKRFDRTISALDAIDRKITEILRSSKRSNG